MSQVQPFDMSTLATCLLFENAMGEAKTVKRLARRFENTGGSLFDIVSFTGLGPEVRLITCEGTYVTRQQ